MDNLYKRLIGSLHGKEVRDFEAVCSILDKSRLGSSDVGIVSDDPYLLFLIFTSLIRYHGIYIHIINPLEGKNEVKRLINAMDIDYIVATDDAFVDSGYYTVVINGDRICKEHRYDVPEVSDILDFKVVTYSPYPCKVYKLSSETFTIMLDCLISDLRHFNLINYLEGGLIPFVSNNPDYLMYFIALKLTFRKWGEKRVLPSEEDYEFCLGNPKLYWEHNDYKTLFIPKKEFLEHWDFKIQSLFEKKWFFKLNMKAPWLANAIIKLKIRNTFKGFKNVLIIGVLPNAWMIDILKSLSSIKFYTIFPIKSAMYYGAISNSFEYIDPANTEWKLERFTLGNTKTYLLSSKLFDPDTKDVCNMSNTDDRFSVKVVHDSEGMNVSRYYLLGNIKNAFNNKNVCIFPETLEKVINSNSFIRDCALLTFNDKTILVINPNEQVLDSNRINRGMFRCIIQKQIDTLNKELPDEYRIRGFVVSTSLIEKDRVGDIIRYPFNRINAL